MAFYEADKAVTNSRKWIVSTEVHLWQVFVMNSIIEGVTNLLATPPAAAPPAEAKKEAEDTAKKEEEATEEIWRILTSQSSF